MQFGQVAYSRLQDLSDTAWKKAEFLHDLSGPSKSSSSKAFRRLCLSAVAVIALIFLSLLFIPSHRHEVSPSYTSITQKDTARLHLLVPATSFGLDLCKLLLSISILGYPTPILINYGAPEDKDPYVQHLAKVQGILKYLRILKERPGSANDLVLAIDGFDIWFQLPPDVLLKRYYATTQASYERAVAEYGVKIARDQDMRTTILFGPDKLCWPIDFADARCWAVPEAPLDKHAYGDHTNVGNRDAEHSMPQWLNSGTIMGPIQDQIDLFEATLDRLQNHFTKKSDQLYFAEVWGAQEYGRLLHKEGAVERVMNITHPGESDPPVRKLPDMPSRTEYHVGLDYSSGMFQTIAFYTKFLTWTRPVWSRHQQRSIMPRAENDLTISNDLYELPADVLQSKPPFAIMEEIGEHGNHTPWNDVDLCYNVATREIPVLLHFTGDKHLRRDWWDRMWYQPKGRELRNASMASDAQRQTLGSSRIDGKWWFAGLPHDVEQLALAGQGGAWTDGGAFFPWDAMCKTRESRMYSDKQAQDDQKAEEDKKAEENRKAEEAKKAKEDKEAEEKKKAEEGKKAEEDKKAGEEAEEGKKADEPA